VEICLSSDKNNFDCFFETRCRKTLNDIRKGFTEEDLIKNLDNESELSTMREIRSLLTKFVNYGSKTLKMVEEVSKGHTDYLCSIETNIRPNKLDKGFVKNHMDKLTESNKTVNIAMFNQTVLDCRSQFHKTNVKIMFDTSHKLLAKAWRSVVISEKRNNSNTFFYDDSQQDNKYRQDKHTNRDKHIPDIRDIHIPGYGDNHHTRQESRSKKLDQRKREDRNTRRDHRDFKDYEDRHTRYYPDEHSTRRFSHRERYDSYDSDPHEDYDRDTYRDERNRRFRERNDSYRKHKEHYYRDKHRERYEREYPLISENNYRSKQYYIKTN